MPLDYRRLRKAAIGTALVFTASGTILGTWVSRLPAVRDHLHASPGQLGGALLAMGIGSLLSMPTTGHLCRRFGTRTMVIVTAALSVLILTALGQADSLLQLTVGLFAFGLTFGSWDVSMNVQGSAAETRAGRQWMPRYHACWSAGSILGASVGALAAGAGLTFGTHFALAALGAAVIVAVGLSMFIDERAGQPTRHEERAKPKTRIVSKRLIMVGLVVLFATIIEGAASDWLAIFLADFRHVSDASAALGFTVFAVAMTTGRVLGTPITERLGRARAVRIGGVLAVAGVLLTILPPVVGLNFAGALVWAAGICLVFPAGVSAAGESRRPAESIAMVTTIGYGSILVGPPLIGGLANLIGLNRALLVLVVLAALVAIFAPALKEHHPAADEKATPDGHYFGELVPKSARETTPSPK
jgi:predicted MFS family arabinose efflux permease